jgi:hypothetical protein
MENIVCIEGPLKTLNEVLAINIEHQLGYRCINDTECVMTNTNHQNHDKQIKILNLIDCAKMKSSEIWFRAEKELYLRNDCTYAALFNVGVQFGGEIEIEAYLRGYRGVFLENRPWNLFLKGIQTIFTGKIWFSRNVLQMIREKVNNKGGGQIRKRSL